MNNRLSIPDPNDSWARVELYRWEHGELPPNDGTSKPLHEFLGLLAMAHAIEEGCKKKDITIMPSPYNVISVMRYIAKKLETLDREKSK